MFQSRSDGLPVVSEKIRRLNGSVFEVSGRNYSDSHNCDDTASNFDEVIITIVMSVIFAKLRPLGAHRPHRVHENHDLRSSEIAHLYPLSLELVSLVRIL